MDNLHTGNIARRKAAYKLPAWAETKDGIRYRTSDDDWIIDTATERLSFHFGMIGISHSLKTFFKAFVSARLRSENPRSAFKNYESIRVLLLHVGCHDHTSTEISRAHLLNYRASLKPTQLYMSTDANDVVRAWARLGIPGVPTETFGAASAMPRHQTERGLAVKLRCPIQGAYTNLEYDGLYKALHAAFARGDIAIHNYALCLISGSICPRPIQLASLRVCDLKISNVSGETTYLLSVPRAKQRGGGYRTQFTDRPLVEEIGMVVEAQARIVREQARLMGLNDAEQAPLFPAIYSNSTFYEGEATLARPTKATIAQRIRTVMEGLGVRSERTGKVINSNATRARRTVGTRAAQEGRSLEEIAALLDHATLGAAKQYIEIRSELLKNIDKKVAILLAPMAQRFAGTIIARGADLEHGIDRHIFGLVDEHDVGPTDIGGCGKKGFCGLGKPIACYTCRVFHPWLDGPHEAILDDLLGRRRKMAADGALIVAATLDDTIVACAEVVRQCSGRKAQLCESSDG